MRYTYNSRSLLKEDRPWLPVMGEFHYSRYHPDYWEESLRKMKAGGVQVIASYVIWIHHEEEEGTFDFSGCRDIGRFVRLCQKVGLSCFLRLGPWVHGEVRNGGFPDWILQKGIPLRCNNRSYLNDVRRFWAHVFEQVKGFMDQDGGPVIGIQIENEYGHVGGSNQDDGEQHMRTLTEMARDIGFLAPYYTATGWGGAATGGLLPVSGGYCEAPWDQRLTEIEANINYVFRDKTQPTREEGFTYHPEKFPFLTAELGGGIQPTHHRRPVATGPDIGAVSLTKLGSGAQMLGYYMFHGGSNPKGKFSSLQESRATGYPNDLPEINYDFNAPIRQYGQISDPYKEIKLLALFLKDFGDDMAALDPEIDPTDVSPEDSHTLRTAWRHDANHGYVFFNNYQRRRQMEEHPHVQLIGRCGHPVTFPEMTIPSGAYGFFPYHMKLGDMELISAMATPLCVLQNDQPCFVFYGDWEPLFCWKNNLAPEILHLSRQDALNAWKVKMDQDYLILSDQYVWEENGSLRVVGGRDTQIRSYPELSNPPQGFQLERREGDFTGYRRLAIGQESHVNSRLCSEQDNRKTYEIHLTYGEHLKDCILCLQYSGDSLQIFQDGAMINDHFYTGQSVEVSMRYFGFPDTLCVTINSLQENAPRFLEVWPEMTDGKACTLDSVSVRDEIW